MRRPRKSSGGLARPYPFLKWAGGKTQLLSQFEPLYPPAGSVDRYVEPFVGSGAVFFHVRRALRPRAVILADNNEELINAYRAVRDRAEEIVRLLAEHKASHSEEHYYAVRALDPRGLPDAARAARLIYLNKTCFNGLYRVNGRGQFNVPIGRYTDPPILDAENLREVARALRGVDMKVAHFRQILRYAEKGDFVYFDPPYQPISKTAFFTAYTDGAFREEDQVELAEVYAALDARGCRLMLSNSYSPLVQRLYERFDVHEVKARRSINSKGDRRGRIPEVVVLNYPPRGAPDRPGEEGDAQGELALSP
jgi:DNA adenine methylase